MMHALGYAGFRRQRDMNPVAEKPGDAPVVRDTKFSRAGSSVVYREPPAAVGPVPLSVTQESAATVRPEDYRVPDKRGVMATRSERLTHPAPFIGQSMMASTLTNYRRELDRVEATPEDEYRAAFDAIDAERTGAVHVREVRALLYRAWHAEPSDRELRLFYTVLDGAPEGLVTWPTLQEALRRVADGIRVENKRTVKRGCAWQQNTVPHVIGPGIVKSTQQIDVGEDGDVPVARPITEGTGMNTTTKDLLLGTAKRTQHVPGYGGHIPSAERPSNVAHHQGIGTESRDSFHSKTLLALTVPTGLPGYQGHRPIEVAGQDYNPGSMMTETAAASVTVSRYWDSRNKK